MTALNVLSLYSPQPQDKAKLNQSTATGQSQIN
jgi:hypothetical protein